jgi:hypothetical protein
LRRFQTEQDSALYEIRPRSDKRGVDLISESLSFGRLWYGEPNAESMPAVWQSGLRSKRIGSINPLRISEYSVAFNLQDFHCVVSVRGVATRNDILGQAAQSRDNDTETTPGHVCVTIASAALVKLWFTGGQSGRPTTAGT